MLKTLIKKQLAELFQSYTIDKKTGKARSRGDLTRYIVLMVLVFGGTGFAFFCIACGMGAATLDHGCNWLYFSLAGLLSIALGVFGSVFNTYASLYLPKDNELLLALPIPPHKLLAARASGVYLTGLMYSAWLWIPAVIGYWVMEPVTALNVVFPVLLTFIIPLFVTVLSCLLGWVVALIVSKTKGKNFLVVFISLLFIVLYFVSYSKISASLQNVAEHVDTLQSTFSTRLQYVYLLGSAAEGSVGSMLLVTLITLALLALCLYVMSKTLMKFASVSTPGKAAGKAESIKQISAQKALLKREFKHFISLPAWMLNGGLGLLFSPVLAVAVLIKRSDLLGFFAEVEKNAPNLQAAMPVLLFAALAAIVCTTLITPASVSLEGKNLWILQSLPVEAADVLKAKVKADVLLNVFPASLSAVIVCIALRFKLLPSLLMLCALFLINLLSSQFGLILNLIKPNLTWTDPVVVIKQGMPVLLSLFGGWLFCLLLAGIGIALSLLAGSSFAFVVIIVLLAGLTLLCRRWLTNKGAKIFAEL